MVVITATIGAPNSRLTANPADPIRLHGSPRWFSSEYWAPPVGC
jgi:hypothetical protein